MPAVHIPTTQYVERRRQLMAQLPADSVVLIPAAKELTRSADTEFMFRQDSYFYYLTGFNEPDALLVLKPDAEQAVTLFCREKDKLAEVWQGRRLGVEAAVDTLQVDAAFTLAEVDEQLRELVNGTSQLWYPDGLYADWDEYVQNLIKTLRQGPKRGWQAPSMRRDVRGLLDEMRLYKDQHELAIMEQAATLSANAHCRAMEKAYPGIHEYQLEAEIHHEFARNGARFPAYNSIVGGGANACILHYTENQDAIADGDLVLIDAGCELAGYAADITRTFPVNGTFSDEQAALYQIVLEAQYAALAEVKPGSNFHQANQAAVAVVTQGLLSLGILQGELDDLIANDAHKPFLMHGIGHWLGLDVHDVGDYQRTDGKQLRAFKAGMVLTIEPGIYIDDSHDVDPKWHNIGIRIEDNVVITDNGHQLLTGDVPKDIDAIEQLMASAKGA
ncbi:Xaa-Pro aminopeptidase [Neiella marina]|uniref:Xaa-Pro aminopeptidase n=1 Tax=Neiella holothuriorum TaxID=2870530 RepID=A0ABS7ELX4_9GAMM|nr:Xaa-Pro aminopeptidase [Neiella holothuriorum]MBW8192682.1 Xaa-Pro aminopeptidase [Neiella holothuriorum]